jgi:hypothetical protein
LLGLRPRLTKPHPSTAYPRPELSPFLDCQRGTRNPKGTQSIFFSLAATSSYLQRHSCPLTSLLSFPLASPARLTVFPLLLSTLLYTCHRVYLALSSYSAPHSNKYNHSIPVGYLFTSILVGRYSYCSLLVAWNSWYRLCEMYIT